MKHLLSLSLLFMFSAQSYAFSVGDFKVTCSGQDMHGKNATLTVSANTLDKNITFESESPYTNGVSALSGQYSERMTESGVTYSLFYQSDIGQVKLATFTFKDFDTYNLQYNNIEFKVTGGTASIDGKKAECKFN